MLVNLTNEAYCDTVKYDNDNGDPVYVWNILLIIMMTQNMMGPRNLACCSLSVASIARDNAYQGKRLHTDLEPAKVISRSHTQGYNLHIVIWPSTIWYYRQGQVSLILPAQTSKVGEFDILKALNTIQ